jgi:hypothetical protein
MEKLVIMFAQLVGRLGGERIGLRMNAAYAKKIVNTTYYQKRCSAAKGSGGYRQKLAAIDAQRKKYFKLNERDGVDESLMNEKLSEFKEQQERPL